MQIRAHNREGLATHGRTEPRRRDEHRGGQADLAAIRQIWATVGFHAATTWIRAKIVRQVMAGAVACRAGSLLLVDGVTGGAGMCRGL
ncbi:MAG: hypothetical protein EAS51_10760 [Microbacteriaceae bacterium]|nr:hypothetical protein EB844_15010 [Paracoccus pantotrophus]RQP09791.1 MAG: hypothetical protein EAS51_10760 [Microbacteriaceae bacterium]